MILFVEEEINWERVQSGSILVNVIISIIIIIISSSSSSSHYKGRRNLVFWKKFVWVFFVFFRF